MMGEQVHERGLLGVLFHLPAQLRNVERTRVQRKRGEGIKKALADDGCLGALPSFAAVKRGRDFPQLLQAARLLLGQPRVQFRLAPCALGDRQAP